MKQKGNVLLILLILFALAAGATIYQISKQSAVNTPNNASQTPATTLPTESTDSAGQTKTFQSKNLKFNIKLSEHFTATDEPSRITVSSVEGQIYINRNGTQFDNLDSYLSDFDKKTSLKTEVDEELVINGNQARYRIFTNSDVANGREKIYFLYSDNFVYKISTTSEDLFDDLNQIAQSFRYTP